MMEDVEKKSIKDGRKKIFERMSEKYPDKDFSDEETLFRQISDDYDGYEEELKGYEEREKGFSDLFSGDPRSAAFLMAWRSGEHPVAALVRAIGVDGVREVLDDEEHAEELGKAHKEFLERVAKEKELEEEYGQNVEASLLELEKQKKEMGLSDEDVDAAMDLLTGIVRDGIVGRFTPESISLALKALNHDVDVAHAAEEAEVRGRNARIEEKLRKRSRGDGVPVLDGKNGGGGTPRSKPDLGALGRLSESNKSIWELGNEKRERYR